MRSACAFLLLLTLNCYGDEHWTAYIGQAYRFGDAVSADVPFDVNDANGNAFSAQLWAPHARTTNWQLYVSEFSADIDNAATSSAFRIRHWQLGGIKATETGAFTPFVGATVGAAQIDTAIDTETRWGFTINAGLRWQAARHLSLIVDARWLGILFNSATSIACDRDNCRLQFDSGAWSQYEIGVAAGVSF